MHCNRNTADLFGHRMLLDVILDLLPYIRWILGRGLGARGTPDRLQEIHPTHHSLAVNVYVVSAL